MQLAVPSSLFGSVGFWWLSAHKPSISCCCVCCCELYKRFVLCLWRYTFVCLFVFVRLCTCVLWDYVVGAAATRTLLLLHLCRQLQAPQHSMLMCRPAMIA